MNRKTFAALIFLASMFLTTLLVGPSAERSVEEPGASRATEADPGVNRRLGEVLAERDGQRSVSDSAASTREPRILADAQFENQMVETLTLLYGAHIDDASVQVQLLQFRNQIYARYPDDGEKRFREILRRAFPDRYGEILDTLAAADDYQDWLDENAEALAELPPLGQQDALLEKQRDLFGPEAAADLAQATLDRQLRDHSMTQTMAELEESTDTTLDQKLDVYIDALHENYGDGPDAWSLENPDLIAQALFGLDSVSRELGSLSPEERQRKINEIREEFGLTDEQIAAREATDARRNARWENGLAYMQERNQLVAGSSGADLDSELASLRERYFAHEAPTIAAEEADGFFRYERPRYYGRN